MRHLPPRPVVALVSMSLVLGLVAPMAAASIPPLDLETKVVTSSPSPGEQFGGAVAISGDTMVAGAPMAGGGEAVVFVRTAGGWEEQQTLTILDGSAGDSFGISVAVDGDTIVVGAHGDASLRGAAYVFTRSGGVWELQQKIVASDGVADDIFGLSVAISGDSIVVAAPGDASNRGAAYVYTRTNSTWGGEQKLVAGDGASFDVFGAGVGISPGSGGTLGYVVVGATYAGCCGAAYVFTQVFGSWVPLTTLTAEVPVANEHFGTSVSLVGSRAVIGADMGDSLGDANHGAVYVFSATTAGAWSQDQKLSTTTGSRFGHSVALSEDGAELVAGAPDETSFRGAAYAFGLSDGTWSQVERLVPTDSNLGDQFGFAVGVSLGRVAIGDRGDQDQTGAAYVFEPLRLVERFAGSNRFATAAATSSADFPDAGAVDTVFVATGLNYPDALAGAAVAGILEAPLLLVSTASIPGPTLTELNRLTPDAIVLLGGTAAVSESVESQLNALGFGPDVVRLAGGNRFTTAVAISQFGFPLDGSADTVVVANGFGFADALAGGPAAAFLNGPVLLTDAASLSSAVSAEITRLAPDRILVVGGTAAVSENVVAQLQAIQSDTVRVSGSNRYSTAVEISKEAFPDGSVRVYLATGFDFPDALAGAAAAGAHGAPMLLVPGTTVPAVVQTEILRLGALQIFVLGGTAVIGPGVLTALGALIGL